MELVELANRPGECSVCGCDVGGQNGCVDTCETIGTHLRRHSFCAEHYYDGSFIHVISDPLSGPLPDSIAKREAEAAILFDLVQKTTQLAHHWDQEDWDWFLAKWNNPWDLLAWAEAWSTYDRSAMKSWLRRTTERAARLLEPRRGRPPKSLTEGTVRLA